MRKTAVDGQSISSMMLDQESLRGSPAHMGIGVVQGIFEWPLRKDDRHTSRSVYMFLNNHRLPNHRNVKLNAFEERIPTAVSCRCVAE